jgi:hypothetical protein
VDLLFRIDVAVARDSQLHAENELSGALKLAREIGGTEGTELCACIQIVGRNPDHVFESYD